jgi:hypothetical protein
LPPVAPVEIPTPPVRTFVWVSRMIVLPAAVVEKEALPVTVRIPVCEMLPESSVTVSVPLTVEALSTVPLAPLLLVSATFPAVPMVENETPPVS